MTSNPLIDLIRASACFLNPSKWLEVTVNTDWPAEAHNNQAKKLDFPILERRRRGRLHPVYGNAPGPAVVSYTGITGHA
jgi:hypothetical protein